MTDDISDAVLSKVRDFTIGFGWAGDDPAAKGSGVLINHGNLHGIMTCAHVVKYISASKQPIGLVRFNSPRAEQFGVLNMNEVISYVADDEPWNGDDIAFIHIPTHLVGNISKNCVFLNIELNFSKEEPDDTTLIPVHAVFGLVNEFTGETTRKDGRATTMLRGVLTPGRLLNNDNVTATLECFKENIPDLPSSFGGTSGGGFWRMYVRKLDDESFEVVHHRLIGIASREDINVSPPHIICQGLLKIGASIEDVRLRLNGENPDK